MKNDYLVQTSVDDKRFQKARMARDHRYDGKFFIAVKTTKIYCRPICPAPSPKEINVRYYNSAIAAQEAGFRPCRRCRPESAPQSAAWLGTQAVFNRAVVKIQAGELNQQSVQNFAEKLGVSDRYLRKLFLQHLGTSPQRYANHVRLMFAKQLLHQTQLPITDIAFSAGFNSIRRFNDAFKNVLQLTPSQVRKLEPNLDKKSSMLQLQLNYQPPYNWPLMQQFLQQRELAAIETVTKDYYQRSFSFNAKSELITGHFKATHFSKKHAFKLELEISDNRYLMAAIAKIRCVLDLDASLETIEKHLAQDQKLKPILVEGLRVPACWDPFEAGVKAILGQQVSVKAAYTHSAHLITELGSNYKDSQLFPTPAQVANADLSFLRMPQSRKNTLKDFAQWYLNKSDGNLIDNSVASQLGEILAIKGIGDWTYQYIKLRSGEDTDAFPEKDLGVVKALKKLEISETDHWSPWRSYATLQLWNSL